MKRPRSLSCLGGVVWNNNNDNNNDNNNNDNTIGRNS